jgi:hypothetical protein
VSIGTKEDKLGIRASDTHSIMYSDVKVPKENRVGEDGFGFVHVYLDGGRLALQPRLWGLLPGNELAQICAGKDNLWKTHHDSPAIALSW